MFFSHEGHHKCREQWPDNALEYERAFNLFLDAILLIFPLIMLSTAYFSITKTLWQGMALERSTKRYAKSTGNNNYQNACKYDAEFMYFIRVFFSIFHPLPQQHQLLSVLFEMDTRSGFEAQFLHAIN